MKGYMYILHCANGAYYTGSTIDLERRIKQHQNGEGANFTKKHLPISLVYFEEFSRIDLAFKREKQVQNWSQKKKEALIQGNFNRLHELSICTNETHFNRTNRSSSPAETTDDDTSTALGVLPNPATSEQRSSSAAETTDDDTLAGNEEIKCENVNK
ncbi:MAG: GIY-YIG nuclease family protein [Bacteroidetes bacterium]|nr:GIY-YIG nuclease family protein [Bacteroidota bacterium]MBU1720726.1 GIY-YIG nuclease family protein [Bacteroidota bacterium]